jgi:type VI secretion system protein ImpE
MDSEADLREGRVGAALEKLQQAVRDDPASAKLRIFLFQLLAVLGRWDRALTQLNVAAEIDPKNLLTAQLCRQALQCEALRAAVFAGKHQPLIFGEPAEWVGWMVQAHQLYASGQHREAEDLRAKALEAAPAVAGTVNGTPFQWIADADPRLGPLLEAIIDGKYFWIPFPNIRRIRMEPPAELRDVVWTPAMFTWTNGGTAVGLIPTRYPGSEKSDDGQVMLARKTDWLEAAGAQLPIGQRLMATDAAEYPLLEIRDLVLGDPIPDPEAAHV